MTKFLDVRLQPVGGAVAHQVSLFAGTSIGDYTGITQANLGSFAQGQHVLIAAHGFNVDRADGINRLHAWEGLLQLPPSSVFIGLLWPGDSTWAHGLDYPDEAGVADQAGRLVGPYIDKFLGGAASISFVSHSLGARVVLSTIANLKRRVRRLNLMAGAINNDCFANEFSKVPDSVDSISVVASLDDEVLKSIFPLGNFFAGVMDAGHPWVRAALGHRGPKNPLPANLQQPYQLPDNWDFGHSDYLGQMPPSPPLLPLPTDIPGNGTGVPSRLLDFNGNPVRNWKAAFSSAFESTRFR